MAYSGFRRIGRATSQARICEGSCRACDATKHQDGSLHRGGQGAARHSGPTDTQQTGTTHKVPIPSRHSVSSCLAALHHTAPQRQRVRPTCPSPRPQSYTRQSTAGPVHCRRCLRHLRPSLSLSLSVCLPFITHWIGGDLGVNHLTHGWRSLRELCLVLHPPRCPRCSPPRPSARAARNE